MSTAGPVDPQSQPASSTFVGGGFALPGTAALPQEPIDPQLLQQTKNEIRVLVQEINQLSRAAIPPGAVLRGVPATRRIGIGGARRLHLDDDGQRRIGSSIPDQLSHRFARRE